LVTITGAGIVLLLEMLCTSYLLLALSYMTGSHVGFNLVTITGLTKSSMIQMTMKDFSAESGSLS
jgi:hypothetical protein